MDLVNVHGVEASSYLSVKYQQWSFNSSLECLAAKAIVRHNVLYKEILPADLVSFIQLPKPEEIAVTAMQARKERDELDRKKRKRPREDTDKKR